jgi:asparagine synthase (glutamine-hydrolysing)
MYLLSSLVRSQGYKVVLSGEGADEVLGGYDIFKEAKIRRFWSKQPESKWRPLLLHRLYPYMDGLQSQSDAYLRAFFHVQEMDVINPFFSHLPRWELTGRIKSFLSQDVRGVLCRHDAMGEMRGSLPDSFDKWDGFSQAQYLEASCLLPGYILSSQGDRMSMAHSVEGRFPFLDYRVVELARRMPPSLKMKVLDEKHVLKRAARRLVPDSITARKKQPYRAPDSSSFFVAGRARETYVDELLAPKRIKHVGIFNPNAVGKLCDKIRGGRVIGAKDNMAFMGILSAQLLVSQFIEKA